MTARLWLIGSSQIFVMARGGMKRSFSTRVCDSVQQTIGPGLFNVAKLAAVFRSTSEFALESAQQGAAYLATLRRVWCDRLLDWLSDVLHKLNLPPVLSVVLGIHAATQGIPLCLALPAFLQS